MIANTTKQGCVFHPIRLLEIVKEKILSLIQRLSQIVSIEKLDSNTYIFILAARCLNVFAFSRVNTLLKQCSFNLESKTSCSKNVKANF